MVRDQEDRPPRMLHPCVVLTPADTPLQDDHHRALAKASLTPRVEHDPHMAMAELCLLRREARQRRGASGDDQSMAPLVILTHPNDEVARLLTALAQHVPDIPVLQYTGSGFEEIQRGQPQADPPVIAQPPQGADLTSRELDSLLRPHTDHASS